MRHQRGRSVCIFKQSDGKFQLQGRKKKRRRRKPSAPLLAAGAALQRGRDLISRCLSFYDMLHLRQGFGIHQTDPSLSPPASPPPPHLGCVIRKSSGGDSREGINSEAEHILTEAATGPINPSHRRYDPGGVISLYQSDERHDSGPLSLRSRAQTRKFRPVDHVKKSECLIKKKKASEITQDQACLTVRALRVIHEFQSLITGAFCCCLLRDRCCWVEG